MLYGVLYNTSSKPITSTFTFILLLHVVPTVNFERLVYTFNENEKLQPVLVLTGLSAIDIIVKVSTTDGSAISSKHLYKLCCHKYGSIEVIFI